MTSAKTQSSFFAETFPPMLLKGSTEVWHSFPENVWSYHYIQRLPHVQCNVPCLHQSSWARTLPSNKPEGQPAFSIKWDKAFQAVITQRRFSYVNWVYFHTIRESFCCHFKYALSEMSERNRSRGCCVGKSWKHFNSSYQTCSLTVRFSTLDLIGWRCLDSQFLY